MEDIKCKNWFESWFDTSYYHVLYKNRDTNEAQFFISNLFNFLKLPKNSLVLDAACGKGRHAFYIQQLGYKVDAFDLSKNSISQAKNNENEHLKFYVHDIRTPFKINHYDLVLNLFTSFGYFNSLQENFEAFDALAKSVKKEGLMVIDFLNFEKVKNNIVEKEQKIIDNIEFNISRTIDENNFIVKKISINDKGNCFDFYEKVKGLTLKDFIGFSKKSNLVIQHTFGNYNLETFDENTSDRLILILKK